MGRKKKEIEKQFIKDQAWAQYADWLEEQGLSIEAAQARANGGLSRIRYRVVYTSSRASPPQWSYTEEFHSLSGARAHVSEKCGLSQRGKWYTAHSQTLPSHEEFSIQMIELTERVVGTLPCLGEKWRKKDESGESA